MGKEKPVPPLPASSHADLQIFVLLAPSKNSNLISLSLANQGPLLKLLRLNFLGKPPQNISIEHINTFWLVYIAKFLLQHEVGWKAGGVHRVPLEQMLGMSGPCLILSCIHSSDLSMSSTLGGPSPRAELQACCFSSRRTQQDTLHLLYSEDPLWGQKPLPD